MKFDATTLRDIVIVLVPMILSLSVHEFAHAWSAFKLGDNTASSQGRMTLNPIAHIDVFGTLLVPIFSAVAGGIGLIGWAKPVPVSPHRFTRKVTMRTGMMITAVAGPASNVLLAFLVGGISMALFGDVIGELAAHPQVESRFMAFLMLGTEDFTASYAKSLAHLGFEGRDGIVALLLSRLFTMNIGLAIFNMLPVPPLDGSRLLPLEWQVKLARYQMVVFVIIIIAINWGRSFLWTPINALGNVLLGLWALVF